MRIRHIVAAGTAAAALTLGAALPASADAHADVAATKGRVTKVKVYQDANFENRNTTFTHNMKNLKHDGWNDTISSAENLGNRTVTFYSDAGYTGASLTLKPHHKEAHFGHHSGMSDATSSVEFS
ncbi:Peptidase inhibitor family I36 [Streptomyces sp. 2323.1]|uniref:peptidase inhibitor family I36 protein n=1 Tax=Streptomyces sp. 2323.1 TaxID=1938841 RepID=UPI000BB784E5|nr:peptidase inhibitor family I36 protein [Streptomyces sp. 2323.1]SOE15259.1 Peptidase inhibitor family I36 [Streptomyces sp. 2323.1]